MNKFLVGFLATSATIGTGVGIVAARQVPTIQPNVFVGPVSVGGLELEVAAKKLRAWWETERKQPLNVVCEETQIVLPKMTPGQLGITLDDKALVSNLPMSGFGPAIGDLPERRDFPLKYRPNGANLVPLATMIKEKVGKPQPATVRWVNGAVDARPETTIYRLDAAALPEATIAALESDRTVNIPLKVSAKQVPDESLQTITDLVADYTTSFPASNHPRCANIKLAAAKLNGVVLLPGQRLSFNDTVGRRTLKAGFQLAGVYKQGKHDVGVGGGICQVSTTLYNAALFANLKIARRSNHSMPVAYVPVGRDATVDYGSLDLVLENNTSHALGFVSTYQPGRLTFRILGQKDPELSVKVVQEDASSWDRGVKTVVDTTLKPGAKKIVEKGSRGHAVKTYRLIYKNGVLVEKEPLGRSYYGGGPRIVATGPVAGVTPPSTTPAALDGA